MFNFINKRVDFSKQRWESVCKLRHGAESVTQAERHNLVRIMNVHEKILDHIESILVLGKTRGYAIRQPERFTNALDNESESIAWHCSELDELGVSWSIQNNALAYVNNADTPNVWESFFTRQLRDIARELVA